MSSEWYDLELGSHHDDSCGAENDDEFCSQDGVVHKGVVVDMISREDEGEEGKLEDLLGEQKDLEDDDTAEQYDDGVNSKRMASKDEDDDLSDSFSDGEEEEEEEEKEKEKEEEKVKNEGKKKLEEQDDDDDGEQEKGKKVAPAKKNVNEAQDKNLLFGRKVVSLDNQRRVLQVFKSMAEAEVVRNYFYIAPFFFLTETQRTLISYQIILHHIHTSPYSSPNHNISHSNSMASNMFAGNIFWINAAA